MAELIGYRKNIEVNTQIDIYRTIIRVHALLTKTKLFLSEETVLAYYCVFKNEKEIDKFILESKVVSRKQVLDNIKSKLKKLKLLVKNEERRLIPCDKFGFDLVNDSSFVISKIQAKTIVKFPNYATDTD